MDSLKSKLIIHSNGEGLKLNIPLHLRPFSPTSPSTFDNEVYDSTTHKNKICNSSIIISPNSSFETINLSDNE